MKILIACEYSGRVRDAFIRKGHDAVSCDLLPSESNFGPHIQGDVLPLLDQHWDMLIAHPPCTYLANSGAKHLYNNMNKAFGKNPERWRLMREGALFFKTLWNAPIERVCIENPIMLNYAKEIIGADQSQTIQPWQFGHGEVKATCLWLRGLSLLKPTNIVSGREPKVHMMAPSPDRWKDRSRTYEGIAQAMADQWG